MICYLDLSNLVFEHFVRGPTVPVPHFVCCFYTRNWHTVFYLTSSCWATPLWQRIWEREVLGQQSKLPQHATLVPGDVLVIQSITADIDHSRERHFDPFVSRRNAW